MNGVQTHNFKFSGDIVGTDCTGSCKSNCHRHMITTMTAPELDIEYKIII